MYTTLLYEVIGSNGQVVGVGINGNLVLSNLGGGTGQGLILQASDATYWQILVAPDGRLSTQQVTF